MFIICLACTPIIISRHSIQVYMELTFTLQEEKWGIFSSAVSLAAANKGKIKHIQNSALRQSSVPSIACILDFEKQATKHDRQMKSTAGNHEGAFTYSFHHYTVKYSTIVRT